eukprot:CAMPEP_0172183184 /NCGR_PEP_ID=MMETSP1050-20130122/18836_1 /TAXON_ID=233186 /ORGANISM="Cryptomonas curvata, Strain CCAP979/52" /LENGTH=219 /DNA_ID=CAMNT_0012856757 /DNA_START=358 /DNA_END=1014 /DNA_ORIENTATION=+
MCARTRKKKLASSAGNWLFCNRRWLEPSDSVDRANLEKNYDMLSQLYPEFSACSKADFLLHLSQVTTAWDQIATECCLYRPPRNLPSSDADAELEGAAGLQELMSHYLEQEPPESAATDTDEKWECGRTCTADSGDGDGPGRPPPAKKARMATQGEANAVVKMDDASCAAILCQGGQGGGASAAAPAHRDASESVARAGGVKLDADSKDFPCGGSDSVR